MIYELSILGSTDKAQALKGALRSFLKSSSMDAKSETSGLSATEMLFRVMRNWMERYK